MAKTSSAARWIAQTFRQRVPHNWIGDSKGSTIVDRPLSRYDGTVSWWAVEWACCIDAVSEAQERSSVLTWVWLITASETASDTS